MRKRKSLIQHLKTSKNDVFALISHLEAATTSSENVKLSKILKAYKERIVKKFSNLEEQWQDFNVEYKNTLKLKNQEISNLKKEKETVASDNYLLEYKKKDLMLLADQLEEAYEEISKKNQELAAQKKQIQEQAEKIQASNKQILKKNEELEQQKEFILDQAEYLEEANQRLLRMNAEVEKQRDEILKKNKELVELNNEKNNLIHIVAHDLKSPLNQIKGLISIIKFSADKLDSESKKCLDMMDMSAGRLNEMIAKILDVKAIEAQTLNIQLEETNLSMIAQDCVERYKLTAKEKDIHLTENIARDIFALVDEGFITQVLENLLSNAIKFSSPNTTIHFKVVEKEGSALLEVKDQGPGISKEDKKKLFKKFQKLSAKPTGNETSTGLGLSIVKQFVEAMEGDIWCESELGKGTSFFVRFNSVGLDSLREQEKKRLPAG